jgi:uncharacterized protein
MKPVIGPAAERYSLIDALRGFAIFGIFGINMMASSLYGFAPDAEAWGRIGKADGLFEIFLNAIIEGKFYTIFSLLFGLGFGLQMQKFKESSVGGMPVFKRRLWGMLLIGLLHMLLLWLGDIIFLYAWLGFVLILFRNKSDRFLLFTAFLCLLLPVLLYPLRFIDTNITLGIPFYAMAVGVGNVFGIDIMNMNPVQMYNQTGVGAFFKTNVLGFFFRQGDLFDQVRPFKVFAVLLLGLWVARHRWYVNPTLFLDAFKKYFLWVLPLAILINVAMAYLSWDGYYSGNMVGWVKTVLYFLGVVPLSLCYVYGFTSMYVSGKYRWMRAFTYVGRMALTNYIFQSLIYVVLFRGSFLGLAGQVGPLYSMVPVLVIFPLQVWASKCWLERYRFGPLEWAWRSMTYGKWQPMKRVQDFNAAAIL